MLKLNCFYLKTLKQFITQTKIKIMRKPVIILITLIVLGIIAYNYIYQDHRHIENEVAQYEVSTKDIASSFFTETADAEAKYLNTTIAVIGKVSEADNSTITLDDKVFCQFTEMNLNDIEQNSELTIKGRVIGYDDLLEQVKLDQCTINK